MSYSFEIFLKNMDNISEKIEKKQKHEEIGKIVSSLQRPFKEVLQTICEKQKKDLDELYKSLGWKN
jgi:Ribonuclease G/E